MPEQPQWSERTLDMPPQDPWADAPTTASPTGGPPDAAAPTVSYPGGVDAWSEPAAGPPAASPFSTGRARVEGRPPTRSFAAEHEPTGTGWPGAEPPRPRHTLADLRRGGRWSMAALLFAFVCWGVWAVSSGSDLASALVIFVLTLAVAGGLFALARLVGRVVLERQFGRVRRTARGSHLIVALFLVGAGVAHLQQTGWVMQALGWVRGTLF